VPKGLVPAMLMRNSARTAPSPNKAKNPPAGLRILVAEDEGLIALVKRHPAHVARPRLTVRRARVLGR